MMMTRERVIKGLESVYHCVSPVTHTCGECPYQDNHVECKRRVLRDAIALLKEQEPVEPTEPDEDNMRYCMACGSPVGYEVLEPSGLNYVQYNYCPECGQAVKWE